jgi:hypothetical protein
MLHYHLYMSLNESPSETDIGDGVAASLSALCLAHCLLLPFLAGAMPFFGTLAHAPWIHGVLFVLAAPLSIWVLGKGYQKHRRLLPCVVGAIGLVMLATGMSHSTHLPSERTASISGAVLLLIAHSYNAWIRWQSIRR